MSFIRGLEIPRFSKATSGLYVIPTERKNKQYIEFVGDCSIESEDFCEILFRILERAKIKFTLEDINKVREVLFLDSLDAIKEKYDSIKLYLGDMSKEDYDEMFGNKNE